MDTFQTNLKLKVVWAIDPFSDDMDLVKSASLLLKDFATGRSLSVNPVYLFRDNKSKPNSPEFVASSDEVTERGQEVMDRFIEKAMAHKIAKLKVLDNPNASHKEAAVGIVRYASQKSADLILIASHGRKGIERWRMGSFAETLLLNSDIPVFILNLLWDQESNFKNILFSTDFSNESKVAFQRLCLFAKFLGSEITIFHKMSYDYVTIPYVAMSHYRYDAEVEEEVDDCVREGEQWVKEAHDYGVHARFVLDRSIRNAVAAEVLLESDKKPGLIALASESPEILYSVFGAVTTKVLRNTRHPVWVFRPTYGVRQKRGVRL